MGIVEVIGSVLAIITISYTVYRLYTYRSEYRVRDMIDQALSDKFHDIKTNMNHLQDISSDREMQINTLKSRVNSLEDHMQSLENKNDKNFERVYEKLDKLNDNIMEMLRAAGRNT